MTAVINSLSLRDLVWVYTTLHTCTQLPKAITSATIHKLGLSIAANAIASNNAGKAIIRSVNLIMIVSVIRPKYAASNPKIVPNITEIELAIKPINKDVLDP